MPVFLLPWKDPEAHPGVLVPLPHCLLQFTIPRSAVFGILQCSVLISLFPQCPSSCHETLSCHSLPLGLPHTLSCCSPTLRVAKGLALLSVVPCSPVSLRGLLIPIPLSPSPGTPLLSSPTQSLTTAGSWLPGWSRRSRCPSPRWLCPQVPGSLKAQGCHRVPLPSTTVPFHPQSIGALLHHTNLGELLDPHARKQLGLADPQAFHLGISVIGDLDLDSHHVRISREGTAAEAVLN